MTRSILIMNRFTNFCKSFRYADFCRSAYNKFTYYKCSQQLNVATSIGSNTRLFDKKDKLVIIVKSQPHYLYKNVNKKFFTSLIDFNFYRDDILDMSRYNRYKQINNSIYFITLPCGHILRKQCIDAWLMHYRNNKKYYITNNFLNDFATFQTTQYNLNCCYCNFYLILNLKNKIYDLS